MDLSINPQDRQASLDLFNIVFRSVEGVNIDWAGDLNTCNEGSTSDTFKVHVLFRINYYRAMAGVPGDVSFLDDLNKDAQKAALMMSVNRQLSHYPNPLWDCYSGKGDLAASKSNLHLVGYGWDAIDSYIEDSGSENYQVGHRRWILYPQSRYMGTGDIPQIKNYPSANALYVIHSSMNRPRPDTREVFVAWPPPGYVPYQIVYPRWSFSYAGADFSSASVSMVSGGKNIPVSLLPIEYGFGENTLVWKPDGKLGSPPDSDKTFTISIQNVLINGNPHNYSYDVIIFNPDV